MKAYIRENLKQILAVTVLFICTSAFVCTNELIAKRLPEISTLEAIEVKLTKGQAYDYTGKEIKPEIQYILFQDEEGAKIKKEQKEITAVVYQHNKQIGSADIEVQVSGYQGSLMIREAFAIRPPKVDKLELKNVSNTAIELFWEKCEGVDGYVVFRSVDQGTSFETVAEIEDKETAVYQDTDIRANTWYQYHVCAYKLIQESPEYGEMSGTVSCLTALDPITLTAVNGIAYNTVQLKWNVVEGAAGYQVYKSLAKDGEYTCIAEIADPGAVSYNDTACECGVEYFYYVKAGQLSGENWIYTEPSEILSARPIPNKVALSGSVSKEQNSVTLAWKETMGAQGFEIYRSVDNASNYQLVMKIEQPNIYTWTDTEVSKDTEYYYRVRAYYVADGQTVTGSYSNSFYKEVPIVYDYSAFSGDVSVITQYAGKVQYVYGGKTVKGWDCSGFTYWVYKNHFGIDIGMTAATQAVRGTVVSKNDRSTWKPGDILVYSEGAGPSHVAIYIGNGKLIHALNEKYDTLIQDVDYYDRWDRATTLIGVRRFF